MLRLDVRLMLALALLAFAGVSVTVIACGERLGADDSTELPPRDSPDATSDAADGQVAAPDATAGDADDGDAGARWSCTTTQTSGDYPTAMPAQCNGARFDAGCDPALDPPDGGCEAGAAVGTYCTRCYTIGTIMRFDILSCSCQP